MHSTEALQNETSIEALQNETSIEALQNESSIEATQKQDAVAKQSKPFQRRNSSFKKLHEELNIRAVLSNFVQLGAQQ